MKKIKLLAILFATYHISFFAAQYMPGAQNCIGTPNLRDWFEQMQLAKYVATHQKRIEHNNQFPKLSQEELNTWVAEKEREIKENQARYKKEKELRRRNPHLKALKKNFKNNHRNKYNPQIKTIECYPTRLLLEWKK